MDKQHAFNKIKEVSDGVNEAGDRLEGIINKTTLSLDEELNYAFPIDETTKNIFNETHKNLNINSRRTTIKTEIGVPVIGTAPATGLYKQIQDKETEITTFIASIPVGSKNTIYQTQLNELQNQLNGLRQKLTQKQGEYDALKKFDTGGLYKGAVTTRKNEIKEIKDAHNIFNITNTIDHQTLDIGGTMATPIALDPLFNGGTAGTKQYSLYDEKQKKRIRPGEPLTVTATTMSGNAVQVTLEGIEITQIPGTPPTHTLSITNLRVNGDVSDSPIQVRDLYVRAIHQNNAGRMFYHDKKLSLTINNPQVNLDLGGRNTEFGLVENNLTPAFLEQRLRQDYETKFNKLQREAFEKTLSSNPEFAKLNQSQKDRLYERMQDLGHLPNGAVNINLGNDPISGNPYTPYTIPEITFSPTTHTYSIMPSNQDYNGFRNWLINQAPKDVLADTDKYREWLRNGLVASVDNGKTHYESFFNDVLKQFTDNVNVKTVLNQTLLDFINDTNTADHIGFEADLAANLNATEPSTNYTKKRYQRLAFWNRGEPQNYLSFFQGQSAEFKTESVTAGGQTFSYSGKLDIQGAESTTVSLKMKDGQEQIYTGGNPVSLIRTLLTSPDIEPPHARFHAGLSVVKSVTKLARENGISLRTSLSPEMLATLPDSVRTTLTGANPMVEIEEENGKLVAKVFSLNLTTRRKEHEYKMFDEKEFTATQSVRDLRQGVEGLLALTNQTMNNIYTQYREARFRSGLRPGLLKKPKYGGLRNMYKKLSFEGESISVGGKSFTLACKNGLFTFSGGDLKKPIDGRNLGDLLAYNPALRGIELRAMHVANEKMLKMYQDKLNTQDRKFNYGVLDEENHRVYIYDKNGNLGYLDTNDQDFEGRWRQYTSGHRYGRIRDQHMPTGFRIMKRGDTVIEKENYENFLRNETLVGSMVRAMSRTHRAMIAWAPW